MLHSFIEALQEFGPPGVFLIALLESFGVPIPAAVDLLVFSLAWKFPHSAYLLAASAVVGSGCGNILLFQAARQGGRRFLKTPKPEAPQKFRRWFARYGLVTVFIPALVPIPLPLKVFVISAGLLHTPFRKFLAVILAARVLRYFSLAWLGMQLGGDGRAFLRHNAWRMAVVSVALAAALYALIKLNDRRTA